MPGITNAAGCDSLYAMSEDELKRLAQDYMQAKTLAVAASREENRLKADLSAAESAFRTMRAALESAATADNQMIPKFTVENVQRVAQAEAKFNRATQQH